MLLALAMRSRSLVLTLGSLPPAFTHTDISRPIFVKILARWPSVFFLFPLDIIPFAVP